MKKFFLVSLALCIFLIASQNLHAQTAALKIGVFDIDLMVRALPEYRNVDSLTANYEQDTLGAQYQEYQSEYQRLDSTFKADSASKRPQSVLDYSNNLRRQMAYTLVYWQQIAQQKSDQYRGALAQPLYAKVLSAYKKVIAANKYSLILKPNTYEVGGTTRLENLFPLVAKEMGVTIDPNLTVDLNQALQDAGTTTNPQQKTGTGKP
ncbi:MAG TPA: OmpH family outer membrane protein [Parafilimonas sp.]|jgi:Skp family chaperone for outer membrane proteins|nr:OmpH family outer membrane protein [Parafilimonas sp.]